MKDSSQSLRNEPERELCFLAQITYSTPVERRREVVSEPLARSCLVNSVGKLLCLGVDGTLCLHPAENKKSKEIVVSQE